jgi:hypothetical protein
MREVVLIALLAAMVVAAVVLAAVLEPRVDPVYPADLTAPVAEADQCVLTTRSPSPSSRQVYPSHLSGPACGPTE